MKRYIQILEKNPLFKDMGIEEIQKIMQLLSHHIHQYKKNEIIAIQGHPFFGIGIVLEGEVVIASQDAEGKEIFLSILQPPAMFGEMAAFSMDKVWPATVKAQEDTEILFLPIQELFFENSKSDSLGKQLVYNLLCILSSKAMELNKKIYYLSLRGMREKIAAYLLEQRSIYKMDTFLMYMNRNELAQYLNVSRPSLSREFCKLRDEGVIDFYKSSVKILDVGRLKEIRSRNDSMAKI